MRVFSSLLILSLALSLAVCRNHCQPKQIHIALSDDYTSYPSIKSPIKAIFHTDEPCNTAFISLQTNNGVVKVQATTVDHFTASYKAGNYSTYVHIFDFPTLEFGKTYEYTCHDGQDGTTPEGPFKFYLPSPKPTGSVHTVVLFGDMDHSEESKYTMDSLLSLVNTNMTKIDAYIHIGDAAYDLEKKAGKHGDKFMEAIQDISASMPYMWTHGNHETSQNFSNANMRFKMPNFAQTQNHHYSFNVGNMHFATFNLDLLILQPELTKYMLEWLDKDLEEANANRHERPWIILNTHRPLYCSKKKNEDCLNNAKDFSNVEDVLNKHKVDLYISGHVHAYERMLPIYKGEVAQFDRVEGDINYNYIVNPKAPVYVLQGKAGHRKDPDTKKVYEKKPFSVTVEMAYSFEAVHAFNSTHLLVENIHSKTGEISDHFYIIKDGGKVEQLAN